MCKTSENTLLYYLNISKALSKDTNSINLAIFHPHTWAYVHTHTHMHACTHARMHTHTHACMHACTHACTHTHMRAHTHTHTHKCTQTCMHAHTHHTCMRTHAHTHTHTLTHTHTCLHLHIHILCLSSRLNVLPAYSAHLSVSACLCHALTDSLSLILNMSQVWSHTQKYKVIVNL